MAETLPSALEESLAVRFDAKAPGDEDYRRAAAHAHVMSHNALEMDDADAHKAAAAAHQKVADMHTECAESYDDEDGEDEETPAKKGK